MTGFSFRPAETFTDSHGIFVALTGGTNSGKTFSALRLARGIAGPKGKIAVLDTEGGRTLHLKNHFEFDANVMEAPFRPERFADAAQAAEEAGYAVLLIDSFSMEWVGMGGVLSWQEAELTRMAGDDFRKRERVKMAAWIKPKMAHKAMVYSLLQRRIPIIFSIRGEESVKPGEAGEKPAKTFKWVCNKDFPFEVTVSFRLRSEAKGIIDLSDPTAAKMEQDHRAIFNDGEQLCEEHGRKLAEWARGAASEPARGKPKSPDSFWSRDSYTIPVKPNDGGDGSDFDGWLARMKKAMATAPTDDAVSKLIFDNSAGLGGLERQRPDLKPEWHEAVEARRERLKSAVADMFGDEAA